MTRAPTADEATQAAERIGRAIEEHRALLADVADRAGVLGEIAAALIATLRQGGRVYLCGNGGSAADAQHIAAELLGRFRRSRPPLPAVALTTDTSALTAIGNDLGFEQVFARQVEALGRRGDVLWLLTTSGRSPNVLAAARQARHNGMLVIGFTGPDGGALAEVCDYCFRAPGLTSDRIQEMHALAYHAVCEAVEQALAEGNASG